MKDTERQTAAPEGPAPSFAPPREESGGFPKAAIGAAAVIVLFVIAALLIAGRKKTPPAPTTLQPPDAYAATLPLSDFAMSESENLSGGKMTYLDGHVRNTGSKTITAATVQVVFQNDVQLPPAIDTVPLALIRTKEPYIDTESLKSDPLKPGQEREFRLTFESIPDNWNQQMPEVRVIRTESQ